MCIEDVAIALNSHVEVLSLPTDAAGNAELPADRQRTGIYNTVGSTWRSVNVYGPGGVLVRWFDPTISASVPAQFANLHTHGPLVQEKMLIASSTISGTIFVIVTRLNNGVYTAAVNHKLGK